MIWLWGATIFLNSALLFWLELMVAKLLLPSLGGSAAVWNTCLMFFQVMLVAGYAYAHMTTARPGKAISAFAPFIHLALLIAALSMLPIGTNIHAPGDTPPALWLVSRLLVMIGLPFFLLASHGPLLQVWFARARHPRSGDPYFLFAASNGGSLFGLLAFPLLIEPFWGLALQTRIWAAAYVVTAVLVVCCWIGSRQSNPASDRSPAAATASPRWPERLRWLVLAAVPSSLLLGVTSYISADVASIPLLWVLPLALYLTTLIVAFSQSARLSALPERLSNLQLFSRNWASWVIPILTIIVLAMLVAFAFSSVIGLICLHLLAFFALALHLHTQLAARRPAAAHLGEFYLWMGLGGALGGVFNAIVAPVLFTRVHEYPFVLALAVMLRPSIFSQKVRPADFVIPLLLGSVMIAIPLIAFQSGYTSPAFDLRLLFIAAAALVLRFYSRALLFGLSLLALLWALPFYPESSGWPVYVERSFYNVHRVIDNTADGIRWLENGNTLHGAQNPSHPEIPLAYYARSGPLGDVLIGGTPYPRVAVIGLGVGSMLAYAGPGQQWTFYELDPAVLHIVRDSGYFTFIAASKVAPRFVLGDGRLGIAAAPAGAFDLIIIDAFGSDSIPVHLLTDEAFGLYLSRLGGARRRLLFNISNRYLDLAPLLAALARGHGLTAFERMDRVENKSAGKLASHWVMVTDGTAPGPLWTVVPETHATDPVWTDNYSSILYLLDTARGR